MKNPQPNILIIITDEQATQTVGAYGSDRVSTPNLDRLSDNGTRFSRAYTTSPVCTPARAGLLSGIYPHNTGAWSNHLAIGQDIKTIGHYYRAQGYRTAYVGKWHLDGLDYFGTGVCPGEFEEKYWYDGRCHLDFFGPERANLWRNESLHSVEALKRHGIDREFTWAGQITNRAVRFFESVKDNEKPWLLILSYDEPHHPWVCPPEYLERFEHAEVRIPESFSTTHTGKPAVHREWSEWMGLDEAKLKSNLRLTFAVTEFVDDEIGRVLHCAEEHKNTYTVFTSDHGNQLGAHRMIWKGPWMYEESINVPLIMRGPNVPAGHVEDSIVSHIDLLPTLMDLSAIDMPPIMDGLSFKDCVLDKQSRSDCTGRAVVEFNRFQIERDDFGAFFPIRCIVEGSCKLVINLFDLDELYDLSIDPLEERNLIDDPEYAPIRDRLHVELLDWMYIRRDAFRTPQWERRPWSSSSRFASCTGGRIRTSPPDGLRPEARGYLTGLPIEYDFNL